MDQKILILAALVAIIVVVLAAVFLMGQSPTEISKTTRTTVTAGQPIKITSENLDTLGTSVADDSAIAVAKLDLTEFMDLVKDMYGSMGVAMLSSTVFGQAGVDANELNSAVAISYDFGMPTSIYDTGNTEIAVLVSAKIDEDKFLSFVKKQTPATTQETYKKVQLTLLPASQTTLAIGFLSDDLLIAGTEKSVKKIIDAIDSGVDSNFMDTIEISEISKELGTYPSYGYLLVTDEMKASLNMLSSYSGEPQDSEYNSVEAIAMGAGKGEKSKLVFLCDSEESAKSLVENQQSQLDNGKQQMAAMRLYYSGEGYDEIYDQLDSVISEISVSQSGKFVIISGPTLDEILKVMNTGLTLWQTSLFSPDSRTANTLSGFGVLRPVEWACSPASGTVTVMATNGAGGPISNLSMTAGSADVVGSCDDGSVSAAGYFLCTATGVSECSDAPAGSGYEVGVDISYISSVGSQHTSSGTIRGTAE